jgi:hypothetical protein
LNAAVVWSMSPMPVCTDVVPAAAAVPSPGWASTLTDRTSMGVASRSSGYLRSSSVTLLVGTPPDRATPVPVATISRHPIRSPR